jgi:endonuclease/exonuclease/phosphatase (EEP) superfamily protein YafD
MANGNSTGKLVLRSIQQLLQLGLIAAWVGVTLGLLGRLHWIFDLCSHFYPHFTVAALVGTIAYTGAFDKKILAVASVAWLTLLPAAISLYFGVKPQPVATNQHLRVVSCNVLTSHPNKSAVIEFLKQSAADVVLLMEVDDEWSQAMKALEPLYPHQLHEPRQDNFGIALLSKSAWKSAEVIQLDNAGIPSIEALFDVEGNALKFIGTHPLPPMGSNYSTQRNLHFVNLARRVRDADPKVATIIVGDLNCTSWSQYFRALLNDSQLSDSRQGFGIQPSWPTSMKLSILGTMRIPIDHALVSRDLSVIDRRVGPFIGSDHFPILIDVGF